MTTLNRMGSPYPTYGESEDFHTIALEIREEIAQELLAKASVIAKRATLSELEAYVNAETLSKEGVLSLKDKLISPGYNNPKHAVLMKLFIDASNTYFFSPYQLRGQLEKILCRQPS
jgi:hypothetical protein